MRNGNFIILLAALFAWSCKPDAKWTDKKIEINMSVETLSAAFIQCNFSTNKETYYLIAIEEARYDLDPYEQQKQFMMLALDSANLEYLQWRNRLLREGEFNIAPFSSHALQYGEVNHVFTGLYPETDYWIYAFAVNPETLEPISTLHLYTVTTASETTVDVRFDYRVKGTWDYIYPLASDDNVVSYFPYVATTRDSLEIAASEYHDPVDYFISLLVEQFSHPNPEYTYYGVKAVHNDGVGSHLVFENGHTYYTGIGGMDGNLKQCALYKFVWNDSIDTYFKDEYPTNLMRDENGWWHVFD